MFCRVFKKVFSDLAYIAYALLISFALISGIVLVLHWKLIAVVWSIGFFFSLFGTLFYSFGFIQFIYLIIISLLFGVTTSMSIYYFLHAGRIQTKSLGSLALSLLGVGCGSCGTLILTSILGLTVGGLLSFLPLRGVEFEIIGVILMLWSLYSVSRKIDNPYG